MDITGFRQAVSRGRFEWRRHVLERLAERFTPQADILEVIATGEQIEDYPTERPFPSALMFARASGRPLHIVVAYDLTNDRGYVITAYEPSLEDFEPDFRARRKKS